MNSNLHVVYLTSSLKRVMWGLKRKDVQLDWLAEELYKNGVRLDLELMRKIKWEEK